MTPVVALAAAADGGPSRVPRDAAECPRQQVRARRHSPPQVCCSTGGSGAARRAPIWRCGGVGRGRAGLTAAPVWPAGIASPRSATVGRAPPPPTAPRLRRPPWKKWCCSSPTCGAACPPDRSGPTWSSGCAAQTTQRLTPRRATRRLLARHSALLFFPTPLCSRAGTATVPCSFAARGFSPVFFFFFFFPPLLLFNRNDRLSCVLLPEP